MRRVEDMPGLESDARDEALGALVTQKRILIVEDEAMIAVLLEDALADAGYATATAYDGTMALNLLKMASPPFDALITDIRLPGSVSGWDVAHRSREINASIGVVFMTGDGFGDWDPALIEGSTFHQKPALLADLIASVDQVLSK